MSWSSTQFFAALATEWYDQAPHASSTARHVDIEPSGLPATGIANRDVRRRSFAGASQRGDSSLVLQEVADLFKSWNTPVGSADGESFEDFLAISSGEWWWCAFEIVSNPAQAANVVLRWLEPDAGSQTKNSTKSITPGNTAALTAAALTTALETIPHDNDATRRVVNGLGAHFHAWTAVGGSANKTTVLLAATSSRQTFAHVTSAFSASDILLTYGHGVSAGALLTNRIRDLRHPWTAAMSSEVATVSATNSASATVQIVPTREDIDIQGALFRSATSTNTTTSGTIVHEEVIAPAVHRTAIIEINHTDFLNSGGSGTLIRSITLPFPTLDRLGFAYQSEGPPIITDAFVEYHTPFQVDTSGGQSGTYPSCVMDVGISNPVLEDAGTRRLSRSALLRRQRLTTNATLGFPPEAGLGVNTLHAGAEVYHGSVDAVLSNGTTGYVKWGDTEQYPTSDYHTGSGTIPSYLTFSDRFVITGITFELPSATAYTHTAQNNVTFTINVCPAGGSPIVGGAWVSIGTYLDLSAAPYSTAFTTAGVITPGSLAASTAHTELLGAAIPKNWKLAIVATATGTVITRGWTVRIHGYTDRGKGVLLQSTSGLTPDVWSDRVDTLTADLLFEAKTELDPVTEPGGTTYAMASLDQGKCFLHIHYWQPRRSASAQAMTYAASNP